METHLQNKKTLWEKCRELTATAKVPFVYLFAKVENNNEMTKEKDERIAKEKIINNLCFSK